MTPRRWFALDLAVAAVVAAAALSASGCMIPNLPPDGTCRNFGVTSWGGGAPWSDVDWTEIAIIDEPLDAIWGWNGDVCGPGGVEGLRAQVAAAKAAGKKVWLNYSTDGLDVLAATPCPDPDGLGLGMGADILSVDSYGGPWDWHVKTKFLLGMLHESLQPGQLLGLVPEGHYAPDWGVRFSENEEAMVAVFYIDWAFHHDRVFAIAPFIWGPGPGTMSERPFVAAQYRHAAEQYPRCP